MKTLCPGKRRVGRTSGEARRDPLVHVPVAGQASPVLVLTRSEVIDHLNEIIVVPATRTVRGLAIEVPLTLEDGMPTACALSTTSLLRSSTASAQCSASYQKRGGRTFAARS